MKFKFNELLQEFIKISVNLPKFLLKSQKDILFKQTPDSFSIRIINKLKNIFFNSIFFEIIKKDIFWLQKILKSLGFSIFYWAQEMLKKYKLWLELQKLLELLFSIKVEIIDIFKIIINILIRYLKFLIGFFNFMFINFRGSIEELINKILHFLKEKGFVIIQKSIEELPRKILENTHNIEFSVATPFIPKIPYKNLSELIEAWYNCYYNCCSQKDNAMFINFLKVLFGDVNSPEIVAERIREIVYQYGTFSRMKPKYGKFIRDMAYVFYGNLSLEMKELMNNLWPTFNKIKKEAHKKHLNLEQSHLNMIKWLFGKDNFLLELILEIIVNWLIVFSVGALLYFIIAHHRTLFLESKKELEKKKEEAEAKAKIAPDDMLVLNNLRSIKENLNLLKIYAIFKIIGLIIALVYCYSKDFPFVLGEFITFYLINLIKFLGQYFQITAILNYNFRY